jgi:hypothetical protein
MILFSHGSIRMEPNDETGHFAQLNSRELQWKPKSLPIGTMSREEMPLTSKNHKIPDGALEDIQAHFGATEDITVEFSKYWRMMHTIVPLTRARLVSKILGVPVVLVMATYTLLKAYRIPGMGTDAWIVYLSDIRH